MSTATALSALKQYTFTSVTIGHFEYWRWHFFRDTTLFCLLYKYRKDYKYAGRFYEINKSDKRIKNISDISMYLLKNSALIKETAINHKKMVMYVTGIIDKLGEHSSVYNHEWIWCNATFKISIHEYKNIDEQTIKMEQYNDTSNHNNTQITETKNTMLNSLQLLEWIDAQKKSMFTKHKTPVVNKSTTSNERCTNTIQYTKIPTGGWDCNKKTDLSSKYYHLFIRFSKNKRLTYQMCKENGELDLPKEWQILQIERV